MLTKGFWHEITATAKDMHTSNPSRYEIRVFVQGHLWRNVALAQILIAMDTCTLTFH